MGRNRAPGPTREHAGANIINTGIGWCPNSTIATMVPGVDSGLSRRNSWGRSTFPWSPPTASTIRPREEALAEGCADMINARPFWPIIWSRRRAVSCPRHQHLHWMQSGVLGPCVQAESLFLLGQPKGLSRRQFSSGSSPRGLAKGGRTRRHGRQTTRRPSDCSGRRWPCRHERCA